MASNTIDKINEHNQYNSKLKEVNVLDIKNPQLSQIQAKSCPRVEIQKRQIQSSLQDYGQDESPNTSTALNKFHNFRNKNNIVQQKTLDSRHSAEEIHFNHHESTSLGKYQAQNNRIRIDPIQIEDDHRLRLQHKNQSMQNDSLNRFLDQRRYSSHVRNESGISDQMLQLEKYEQMIQAKAELDSQKSIQITQPSQEQMYFDEHFHQSGEQTLKSKVVSNNGSKGHTRNSSLIDTLNNNIKLQQQCIELFENNQQLLNQLKQYGRHQNTNLNVQVNHDNIQQLKQYYHDKKTASTTINRSSQEQLITPVKNLKKNNHIRSKNHQKQMSLGQGILFPKSYIDSTNFENSSTQGISRMPDALYDSSLLSTERMDERQSSVLFPNFMEPHDYKEKQQIQSCQQNSNSRTTGMNSFHQSLDRTERKISGIQNKIASMNGQIILNLNQSIFRNMHQQHLQKQLQQLPVKQQRQFKLENIQSPRNINLICSLPNCDEKYENIYKNEAKHTNIYSSSEQFETNRSLHKSPNPGGTHAINYNANTDHLIDMIDEQFNKNKSNFYPEKSAERKNRIHLTDVKKRREDSLDPNIMIQVDKNMGAQVINDNSPLLPQLVSNSHSSHLKNHGIQNIKNIFVEAGQTLSTGANHINRQSMISNQPSEQLTVRQVNSQPKGSQGSQHGVHSKIPSRY